VLNYFNEICNTRPKETRAEGIVLRDPKAWYYEKNAFLTKENLEETIVMKLESGKFKW
jgi:hypothetical protein